MTTSTLVFWASPLVYLAGSAMILAGRRAVWGIAHRAAATVVTVTLFATAFAAWLAVSSGQAIDAPGTAMAALIALLGWAIVRYSRRYLEGEAGQVRYAAALLLTLAAVNTVVLTSNLAVLLLAWSASSLALHHLLTFYPDRAAAQVVAHKKFIASRLAELAMLSALILVYREVGSLQIADITGYVEAAAALPRSLELAAVLVALATIMKSAQLPVHGWLIQVMEAPTPVSALLHAGIVNIGGFVLIRLADLVSAVPAAQALLVVIGSLTAVLAGLVMMTRISIKVRLAWSTCAQMGFMLMECGLGLYELALLHLIAHSLYKAHAFLASGETVAEVRRQHLAPAQTAGSTYLLALRVAAAPVAIGLVAASAYAWRHLVDGYSVAPVALLIVGIGLAPLLWPVPGTGAGQTLRSVVRVLGIAQLYLFWHLVAATVAPPATAPSAPLAIWAGACFLALYGLQSWLLAFPAGRVSARLYPWAYAGFYLDERFTRLTFRIWPARIRTSGATAAIPVTETQ